MAEPYYEDDEQLEQPIAVHQQQQQVEAVVVFLVAFVAAISMIYIHLRWA